MNLLILYRDIDGKMFPWSCLVRRCGTTRARYWTGTQFSHFSWLHDNPCLSSSQFVTLFAFSRLVLNRFIRFYCKNFCPCKCYQITVVPGNLPPWLKHRKVALEVGFGWDSFLETQWRWRFLWYYCSFMSFSHFRGIISDPGLMSEWAGNAEILAHFTQCDFYRKFTVFGSTWKAD